MKPLDPEPAEVTRQLRALLRAAAALREQLDQRERSRGLVHTNLCLHAGEIVLRGGSKADIIGGPLVRPDVWAPREATAGVCVTHAAADKLGDAGLTSGPGGTLTLQGPFAGP